MINLYSKYFRNLIHCFAFTTCLCFLFNSEISLKAINQDTEIYTEKEIRILLRSELNEFEKYVKLSMEEADNILKNRNISIEDLAKLDIWQNAQLARLQVALATEDPILALVDAWAVGKSLAQYLDQNSYLDEIPESIRSVALDMLKRREDRLSYIASKYIPEDSFDSLSSRINLFTTSQSIPKNEVLQANSQRWSSPLFSVWLKSQAAVGSVLQLSLSPVKALKGVSDSGKALSGIRDSTSQAVQVASEFPTRIRTEFQLALEDLLAQKDEILEILDSINQTSNHLSKTATESHLTIQETKESLEISKELIPKAESLIISIERTVNATSKLMKMISKNSLSNENDSVMNTHSFDIKEYQITAVSISNAASQIQKMLEEIRQLIILDQSSPNDNPDEHFNIREYQLAADSIQRGAIEIRGILSDVTMLMDHPSFQTQMGHLLDQLDQSTEKASNRTKNIINYVTFSLILIGVLFFVLACSYRYWTHFLTKKIKINH